MLYSMDPPTRNTYGLVQVEFHKKGKRRKFTEDKKKIKIKMESSPRFWEKYPDFFAHDLYEPLLTR